MSITILKPGIMSSVQDLGRWGYQQYGIPIGGAMDKFSAALTNIICGNDENEGVIEMTLHGASILFNEDKFCAFTGGGCRVFAEEMELPFNRLLYIPALTMLETKPSATGCRSYFAVAGGFDIRKQMGSESTYAASGIGGMNGRYLKSGDMLSFKKINPSFDLNALKTISGNLRVSHWQVPDLIGMDQQKSEIYVLAGPEYDRFDEASRNKFFASTFTIGLQSNRMGYRLEGEKILMKEKHEMVSTPVTSGIIQVTHEGDPIILMADAQTTGGYPRIARVCSADIIKVAQMKTGNTFKFSMIDKRMSEKMSISQSERLGLIKRGINYTKK